MNKTVLVIVEAIFDNKYKYSENLLRKDMINLVSNKSTEQSHT